MIALLLAAALQIPSINVVDDSGISRSTDAWRGTPTIVVPMYTRCPLACPAIAESLKRATLEMKIDSYRVVFFSFDPRDTPADLRAFREKHRLPLAWTLVSANPADTRRFMDALNYRYSGTMSHANAIAVLTPDLTPAKMLPGTDFSPGTVAGALAVARGGHDWVGRFGSLALAVLLLICVLSAIYLGVITQRTARPHRARNTA